MINVSTYPQVRLGVRAGFTGFAALSGLEGCDATYLVAGGLGSMATFAWRCTG
jgi:hypothetical protein